MMRVLITGGTGFIGSNLVEGLSTKYRLSVPTSRQLDLTNQTCVERFFQEHTFDAVIHCATWNPVTDTAKDPDKILENNLKMFHNLARVKGRYGNLVFCGSGADLNRLHCPPMVSESFFDTFVPTDAYGFSKYLITKQIHSMDDTYNLRLFGVFGKREDWRIRFISNAICMAMHDLPIVIKQDVLFDYFYVNDLCDIVSWFVSTTPKEKSYNVCTGRPQRLSDLAAIVLEVMGKNLPVNVIKTDEGREFSADNTRLKTEMRHVEFTPLKKAVARLAEWYFENSADIPYDEIKERHLALMQ